MRKIVARQDDSSCALQYLLCGKNSKERGCREHGWLCASELWFLVPSVHVVATIALGKICVLEIVAGLE